MYASISPHTISQFFFVLAGEKEKKKAMNRFPSLNGKNGAEKKRKKVTEAPGTVCRAFQRFSTLAMTIPTMSTEQVKPRFASSDNRVFLFILVVYSLIWSFSGGHLLSASFSGRLLEHMQE